jgi:hypothetical protein
VLAQKGNHKDCPYSPIENPPQKNGTLTLPHP